MKCPYTLNFVEVTTPSAPFFIEHLYDYPDGRQDKIVVTNNVTIVSNTQTMTECIGKQCAAWRRGRCRRRA